MIDKELRDFINWGNFLNKTTLSQDEILEYFDDISAGKYHSNVEALIGTQTLSDDVFMNIFKKLEPTQIQLFIATQEITISDELKLFLKLNNYNTDNVVFELENNNETGLEVFKYIDFLFKDLNGWWQDEDEDRIIIKIIKKAYSKDYKNSYNYDIEAYKGTVEYQCYDGDSRVIEGYELGKYLFNIDQNVQCNDHWIADVLSKPSLSQDDIDMLQNNIIETLKNRYSTLQAFIQDFKK